jgi:putative inorganic carbon (HCO3(-)) transporter
MNRNDHIDPLMSNPIFKYLPASLRDSSEKMAFLALAGCVSLVLVSIAISQIMLAATIVGFIWMQRKQKKSLLPRTPIVLPLFAFMIWILIAVFASSNILLGLTGTKKFYLYLLVFLVPTIVDGEDRLNWIHRAIFAVAVVSSGLGLVQYAANPNRDLLHRISGFMSQWMTYSGLLMLALVLLAAYALSAGVRQHKWIISLAVLLVLSLILSQTRSAWMGAIVGIIVLVLMRRPRAIVVLAAAILVFYALSPAAIKQRFRSGLNPADPNTRNRIELFETSIRLIRDHPWFGVGPKNVNIEALKYRGDHNEFPDWMYQHMHNNVLEIAAETGIPGLILWLWFMVRLAWDALRCYRYTKGRSFSGEEKFRREALTASSAALAAWAALMSAGMFEYNFGDSEVLMLFLFIASAPYAFMIQRSKTFPLGIQGSSVSTPEQ